MKERPSAGWMLFMALALTAVFMNFFQCKQSNPKTAKDFIGQYGAAWQKGDVDKIMSMKEGNNILDKTRINEDLKEQIKDYSEEKERERISQDVKDKGAGYRMWSNTTYVSEKDHKDHVHVDVKVRGFNSSVVLVRQPDGSFKISDYPSMYRD
jgi:hypothetical protein